MMMKIIYETQGDSILNTAPSCLNRKSLTRKEAGLHRAHPCATSEPINHGSEINEGSTNNIKLPLLTQHPRIVIV